MTEKKVALVTGASKGIGRAIAMALAKQGVYVIVNYNGSWAKAEETCRLIEEKGGECECVQFNVAKVEETTAALQECILKHGRLDILVNNAGGGVTIKDVREFSVDEIDSTIKLNLNSVIYGCRAFADMMMKQKRGTMINISSVCARQCWPSWSVYAAAKAGVLNFSKGMYLEMQPYNVRVSCVVPSSASTGFQKACGIGETTDKLMPEDIAETVLYIANLPERAVVEDVTVWGIDKEINPL